MLELTNNREVTLDSWAKRVLKQYKQSKKPFTSSFNKCKIAINEGSTIKSVKDFYYHNVNLTQFEGWSYD